MGLSAPGLSNFLVSVLCNSLMHSEHLYDVVVFLHLLCSMSEDECPNLLVVDSSYTGVRYEGTVLSWL